MTGNNYYKEPFNRIAMIKKITVILATSTDPNDPC